MNKKTNIIVISILLIVVAGVFFYFFTRNSNSENSISKYQTNRTSSTNNNTSNVSQEQINDNKNAMIKEQKAPTITEEQIAIFSTKIYSNDSARQNNIKITCNTLNNTVVKNGEMFSFCETVGPASSSKGYQEADIFDKDGNKKKGLGGGNCQISTTLYNALLTIPSLVITERHEHSNYVPYIEDGKDAAVAYGSYDLKFRNNYGHDIKICAEASNQNVTVSIIALKQG